MEDMMKALLDVVRAQHTATEGSEERPFDINDIIDMALNITGRPEEPEEQQELSDTIQKLAESLAPDIFPPKTFEEMDDSEQAASAVNMIEERLRNGGRRRETAAPQSQQEMTPQQNSSQMQSESHEENPFAQVMENENANIQQQSETADGYGNMASTDSGASEDYGNGSSYDMFGQDDVNHQEAANLNDLIYNNFMQMMGLNDPKVEYPFDRSQIRYGREKTATEMLAEDEANKAEERALEEQRRRPVSAWELAQSAVDKDEEAHQKEEYEPKEMKMPETKSASQLAAEAIAKAKEEDQMKLEAEKRAERLMEEARKRGKDPMEFALHQQEILNYMEKNSDELVSFEDYEDLSPEEKLEIEKELYREKQIEAGVAPEDISDELPDEILEQSGIAPDQTAGEQNSQESAGQGDGTTAQQTSQSQGMPTFSDDMLRMISQEVVQENAEMILAEDANADLGLINETIFENLKNLMSQTGGAVTQEDMESLIGEVISRNTSSDSEEKQETLAQTETGTTAETAPMAFEGESAGSAVGSGMAGTREPAVESSQSESQSQPMSAVELARAAQQAAKPEPQEARETKSAVELAKEAQENAVQKKAEPISETEEELSEDDLNFDELDLEEESEESQSPSIEELKAQLKAAEEALAAEQLKAAQKAGKAEEEKKSEEIPKVEEATEQPMEESASTAGEQTATEESSEITPAPTAEEVQEQPEYSEVSEKEAEEFEYVDPGELVLGDHTQAEIDEALDNLASLGLEGEVYERAKRMLLLELAGSEVALDAWLEEQENGKKKKAAVSALDTEEDALEDLEDLDEDDLERELELAMDEDFIEEDLEEPANEETLEESSQDKSEETEKEAVSEENLEENSVEKTEDESDKTEGAEDVSEQPESILKEASEEEISSEEENSEEEEGETSEAAQEEAANKEFSETEEEAANREYSETEEKETANRECSETEEKEIANKGVSKKTEKEAEYKEAEYISESEDTIQVEKTRPEKEERTSSQTKKPAHSERTSHSRKHKNIVKRKEKTAPEKEEREFSAVVLTGKNVEEKEFQVSVRNPFVLKNSASFMDKFEEYIVDTQENRKLSTGFKRLDAMLRYGLHKGSYFVDATPQYLKNGFMQQIADRAAESGVDVLYISTELTRYDLMVDTISRLSYEMNKKDEEKAVSSMAIMTGEKGADIRSLKDELNWYRGRISEHLFVLDQEAVSEYVENMEDASAGDILAELIRSIVTEGAHKPVVFIDNIENILSVEDSEDMKPLMDGIRKLAKELGIPIIMSYGYAPAESENELDPDEIEYHKSLGNMCDVYLELKYADMITEDYEELTEDDIQEMVENGEMLLINVQLHKNRRKHPVRYRQHRSLIITKNSDLP
jgi:archaellum biogenesis ATPase FlaH